MKSGKTGLIILTILLTAFAMAYAHGGRHSSKESEGTVSYSRNILPIFESNCSACHGAESPEHTAFMRNRDSYVSKSIGPRMDNYTLMASFVVWPDTGSLMRALDDGSNTNDGKPGRMYQYLGSTDKERKENLDTFRKWVGNWTLKDWAEISKDELGLIQLAP
jgi:hypothetical protein